jgi:ectoine hydroxylase
VIITDSQLRAYQEDGYVLMPHAFSQDEVKTMRTQLPEVFAEDSERRVVEKDGNIVRSVYGSHTTNEIFHRLTRHPRIVEPVRHILGTEVYVYQFKINAKAALGGDMWSWHQDYIFWRKEDNMPSPRVVNVVIFLDDVNEFNGPMYLLQGSHKLGIIDVEARSTFEEGPPTPYLDSPAWISNLTADLKYSLDKQAIASLVSRYNIVAPKGPAGSVLFFDSNIVHGSPNNISPFDRVIIIITFNSVENIPPLSANPRPDFLVSRNHEPVVLLSDDTLLTN